MHARSRLDDDGDEAIRADARLVGQPERSSVARGVGDDDPAGLERLSVNFRIERSWAFGQCRQHRRRIGEPAQRPLGPVIELRHDLPVEPGARHEKKRRAVDDAARGLDHRS